MPKLRVAIPDDVLAAPPDTGHGKVWHNVVAHLAAHVHLSEIPTGARGRLRRARLHPQVWLANGHAGAIRARKPVVAQVHEVGGLTPEVRQYAPDAFLALLAPLTEAGVRGASAVITPSESARREVIEAYGYPAERVTAVAHGVDSSFFRPGRQGGAELVAEARGGQRAPYVLFAARPYPRKNVPALKEAMARLAAIGLPHVLVVAGGSLDGPGAEEAMREIAADPPGAPGLVTWLPDVSNEQLAQLMAGASAFCLPSFSEGFGLTVLEAMACGVPVVVSDRGALPEVVDDAGLIVEPHPEALAAALRPILESDEFARRLGAAARARAITFSWERTARGWLDVLARTADGG
jgi:glycosyltransferase involved in cell wall biosynthesis